MEEFYDQMAAKANKIAIKAGIAILNIYKQNDIYVANKEDDSPLTLADQKSNQCINKGLLEINSSIPIISEENDQLPFVQRKDFDYCWIVDPLDGTKEFIKRNGEFTVNIALAQKGTIVLGVVYAPVTQSLYWAIKHKGAFKKVGDQETVRLRAQKFNLNDNNLMVVCSRSHLNKETQDYIDQLSSPQLTPKGSSLKMMEIAEGKAHLYPRFGPTMEWDTAASQIIVEEAGGQLISPDTKRALLYNKENLLNPNFLASGNYLN